MKKLLFCVFFVFVGLLFGVNAYANEYRSIGTIPKSLTNQVVKQNIPQTQIKSGKLASGVFSTKEGSKAVHYLLPIKNNLRIGFVGFLDESTLYSIGDKTYVPIRFVNKLGLQAIYDKQTKTTFIKHPKDESACTSQQYGQTVNVSKTPELKGKIITINNSTPIKRNGVVVGIKNNGSNLYVELSSLVKYLQGSIFVENGLTYILSDKDKLKECTNLDYRHITPEYNPTPQEIEEYLENQTRGIFINKDNVFSISFDVTRGTFEIGSDDNYYEEPHDFSIKTYCINLSKGICKDNQERIKKYLEKIFVSLDYKFPQTTFFGHLLTLSNKFFYMGLVENSSLTYESSAETLHLGMYWQNYFYSTINPYGYYVKDILEDELDVKGVKDGFRWNISGIYSYSVGATVSLEYGYYEEFKLR